MASRFFSYNSDKKTSAPSGPKKAMGASGKAPSPTLSPERTANWKPAGKGWSSSFNRAMKSPVPKTRAAKQGID